MSFVAGISEAIRRLAADRAAAIAKEQLARSAEELGQAVRATLSHLPGEDHSAPWLRSGQLRDSIAHSVADTQAIIGSPDPVALYQELGTPNIPPRPFFAATAAAQSEAVAEQFRSALEQGDRLASP